MEVRKTISMKKLLIFGGFALLTLVLFQNCSNNSSSDNPQSTLASTSSLSYKDVDQDGDGFCKVEFLNHELCKENFQKIDCNDSDPSLNSLTEFYADQDGDGYGSGEAQAFCLKTPPEGYSRDNSDPDDTNQLMRPNDSDGDQVANEFDCDADDSSRWSKKVYYSTDLDGDNHWALNKPMSGGLAAYVCSGDELPKGFSTRTYFGDGKELDCDDSNFSLTNLKVHQDRDGDGLGFFNAYACRDQSGKLVYVGESNSSIRLVENSDDCNDWDSKILDQDILTRTIYSKTKGSELTCKENSALQTKTCSKGVWSDYSGADAEKYFSRTCKVIANVEVSCSTLTPAPSQFYGTPPTHFPTCNASCPAGMNIIAAAKKGGGSCEIDYDKVSSIQSPFGIGRSNYKVVSEGAFKTQILYWDSVTCKFTCSFDSQ